MKIRFLTGVARDLDNFQPGQVVETDDFDSLTSARVTEILKKKYAEKVVEPKETATADDKETAAQ